MKCPSCGKENPASEQYCLDCGSELAAAVAPAGVAQPAAAAATPAMAAGGAAPAGSPAQSFALSDDEFQKLLHTPPADKCPHCGAAAPAGGAFCDNCGESLTAAPAAAPTAAAPSASAADSQQSGAAFTAVPATAPPVEQRDPSLDATRPITPLGTSGPKVTLEYAGPSASGNVAMTGDEAKIGRRDADAGIFPELDFDGNDMVVDAGERVHAVSRRHGRIFRDGGELKFEDLGSTNGSTLNGAAVLAHDPQSVKDGDKIVLGRTCRITVHAG